jgi:hypothetical protein
VDGTLGIALIVARHAAIAMMDVALICMVLVRDE